MADPLTEQQGRLLTDLARRTIQADLAGEGPVSRLPELSSPALKVQTGTFVTLKIHGKLRGCMGNLESSEDIVNGVQHNAVSAAFHDPRFAPLRFDELSDLDIEVSVLSQPEPLTYSDGGDLLARLRPGIDGVILRKGGAGATFLPQVWEQLPRPADFLGHLCHKAGLPENAWQDGDLEVSIYQVQYFHEEK